MTLKAQWDIYVDALMTVSDLVEVEYSDRIEELKDLIKSYYTQVSPHCSAESRADLLEAKEPHELNGQIWINSRAFLSWMKREQIDFRIEGSSELSRLFTAAGGEKKVPRAKQKDTNRQISAKYWVYQRTTILDG
jgi:hypothetical protein